MLEISQKIPTRNAVKVLPRLSGTDNYLFVQGERELDQGGWINLLGGGIEDGEQLSEALEREIIEEASWTIPYLGTMELLGDISGEVVNNRNQTIMARWTLFVCEINMGFEDGMRLAPQSQRAHILSSHEVNDHQFVSPLAKQAFRTVQQYQDTKQLLEQSS